jgi:heat-inducible transcriptional repressor
MVVEQLDDRKKEILKAIIHEHILTAEPVGSRTLAKAYQFGVSSATIRNEMSDLEDLGYLEQPYTSAGRIPSDEGYRFYVDSVIQEGEFLHSDYQEFIRQFNHEKQGLQSIMSSVARMLSRFTRYTSLVSEPQLIKSRLKQLQIIRIDGSSVLIVMLTDTGIVHSQIIQLDQEIEVRQINYLNSFLSSYLKDKELSFLTEEFMQEMEYRLLKRLDLSKGIFEFIYNGLVKISSPVDFKIYLGGTSYILEQPEFNNLDNLKKVLKILDHEETLRRLLNNVPDKGIDVMIGQENELEEMQKCSIVFANYTINDKAFGKIGVIGPTRMEYQRVISIVSTVADALSKIISELSG